MKILKNNFNTDTLVSNNVKPYPRKIICEGCGSELEYDKSDTQIGALGGVYVFCPLCDYDNMIDSHEDAVILTKNNIEFPTHFFHTSVDGGAVDCCDNKHIKSYIDQAINYFRQNKDEFVWTVESGNLYIAVYRDDGDEDYYVMVTDNYYSTYLPFEDQDYKVVI